MGHGHRSWPGKKGPLQKTAHGCLTPSLEGMPPRLTVGCLRQRQMEESESEVAQSCLTQRPHGL